MPLSRKALQSRAGAARGQAHDIRNEDNELSRIKDYLFSEQANDTGKPVERIHKDMGCLKHLNAQEALEYDSLTALSGHRELKMMHHPKMQELFVVQ